MISYLSDFANGWTLIDLILIIGFGLSTIHYYKKSKLSKDEKAKIEKTLDQIIKQLKTEIMHYNTTNESGQTLIDFDRKADNQEERVLSIFKAKKSLAPSQVWNAYGMSKTPITSIRRAITDLTKSGHLIKTSEKQLGYFGRPETIYRLKTA